MAVCHGAGILEPMPRVGAAGQKNESAIVTVGHNDSSYCAELPSVIVPSADNLMLILSAGLFVFLTSKPYQSPLMRDMFPAYTPLYVTGMQQPIHKEFVFVVAQNKNVTITHTNRFCHPSTNGDNNVAVVPDITLRSFIS